MIVITGRKGPASQIHLPGYSRPVLCLYRWWPTSRVWRWHGVILGRSREYPRGGPPQFAVFPR